MKPLPEIQPGMNESVLLSRFLRVMNGLGVDNNRYVSWVGKRKIIRFTTFDEVHAENEKMNENEKKNENKEDLFFQPASQDFLCASQTHLHGSMSWIKSKLGTSPDPLIRQTLAVSADQGVIFLLWRDYNLLYLLGTRSSHSITTFSAILHGCTQAVCKNGEHHRAQNQI